MSRLWKDVHALKGAHQAQMFARNTTPDNWAQMIEVIGARNPDILDAALACLTGTRHMPKREWRQPISEAVRWAVWERDDFTCQHCGDRRYLTIDHVYPHIRGGSAAIENLQTLCKRCNSRKGARVRG